MGRVKNWLDLRSLKWKIRILRSVGIHSNTSSWKFENIQTKTVPTTRSSSLKPVPECTSDFDLTWWPDLLTWEVKICTQGVFLICAQAPQSWRRCAPPLFRYARKTGQGIICQPPVRVLTGPMVTWLWVTLAWNFHHMCEKRCMKRCVKRLLF